MSDMGYLLVKEEVLKEKGIKDYELMPDGRAITDFSMLRVLGSVADVEIISTAEEVMSKIKEQNECGLYSNPVKQDDKVDIEKPIVTAEPKKGKGGKR